MKYCITEIATKQSPAVFTRLLIFLQTIKNHCIAHMAPLQLLCNEAHVTIQENFQAAV